jgi:hypothetical protein
VRLLHNTEIVESDDSADLMYFSNAHEVKLDNINHTAFCSSEILKDKDKDNSAIKKIKDCFFHVFEKRENATPEQLPPPMLIFLVHGIRDYAEWQEALALEIYNFTKNVIIIPVQYGYFNAFQFLSPLQRNRASRIFADKYIQAKLKYPGSKIAIAAHSNGTYAVAKAFERYNTFHADRLYLAGSVLPQNFNWANVNITTVRNDIANFDWPVGFLCNVIKCVDRQIGVAGFRGFTKTSNNNMYLEGPHGAALAPPYRSEVAKFLATGEPTSLTIHKVGKNLWMEGLSILALPIFLAILTGLGYLYVAIANTFSAPFAVILSALLTILLIVGLSSI